MKNYRWMCLVLVSTDCAGGSSRSAGVHLDQEEQGLQIEDQSEDDPHGILSVIGSEVLLNRSERAKMSANVLSVNYLEVALVLESIDP